MTVFEIAPLLYAAGGAGGALIAVFRHAPSSSIGLYLAIPLGGVCGIAIYRGLMHLPLFGKAGAPQCSPWVDALFFGIVLLAPVVSATLSFVLTWLLLHVIA